MPLREVTKKRKGKANKRTAMNRRTIMIRTLRAAGFLLVGIVIVYFYYLYETGSLLAFFHALKIKEGFQTIVDDVTEHPFKIGFYLIYSLAILGIGFWLGRKKWIK
ncbi:hypothetical protein [Bacillus suaedaesalsae]|uniref:Uncharacterized protein n=1 Tax=Bacillus suaedaesalsae TaxID=2810349 RepID=A0ABS2DFZ0_9BACI|nr:hypothetical protein [Bacillus suaedaesalsae]MBM6617387.1 hypothetical protein [Bacillus suaedaesalsae]